MSGIFEFQYNGYLAFFRSKNGNIKELRAKFFKDNPDKVSMKENLKVLPSGELYLTITYCLREHESTNNMLKTI